MEIINIQQQTKTTQRRWMHKTLLLFLFTILLLTTPTISSGGFRLCGLKLTMTLNAICKNQLCGGYIMSKRKSFDNYKDKKDFEETNEFINENEEEELIGQTERRKKKFYPYGAFGPVKKSGIATECCSKRCTLGYMKTYCCANSVRFGE